MQCDMSTCTRFVGEVRVHAPPVQKVLRTVARSTVQSQGSLVACRQSSIFKRDIDNLVCQETDELKKKQMEVLKMLLSVE